MFGKAPAHGWTILDETRIRVLTMWGILEVLGYASLGFQGALLAAACFWSGWHLRKSLRGD